MSAMINPGNESGGFIRQAESKGQYESINTISQAVMAVATLATLLATLLNISNKIPPWFIYIPLGILILALPFPLISGGKKFRVWWIRRRAAQRCFPALVSLSKQFRDLTSLRLSDTIICGFGKLQQSGGTLQMRELAELSEWITNNLISRLEKDNRRFRELTEGLEDLFALTLSFHRAYFINGIKKARSLGASNIGDEEKKTIEVARESFARYLERFESFCNELNERVETKVVDHSFEKARPL